MMMSEIYHRSRRISGRMSHTVLWSSCTSVGTGLCCARMDGWVASICRFLNTAAHLKCAPFVIWCLSFGWLGMGMIIIEATLVFPFRTRRYLRDDTGEEGRDDRNSAGLGRCSNNCPCWTLLLQLLPGKFLNLTHIQQRVSQLHSLALDGGESTRFMYIS